MEASNPICISKLKVLKFLRKVKFQYKYWIFYLLFTFVSLILVPIFALRPRNVKNSIILSEISKHISKVIGIKWYLRNFNILAEETGAVVVANHQSSLDILGMTNIWHAMNKCAIVGKLEILYSPIGLTMYLMGVIFVNRKHGKESLIKLRINADYYFKNKTKIWIYPEGKRNGGSIKMLPFKAGAFITAISSQVPIVPVIFSPYYFINKKQKVFNRGHIIVQCLDPIPTEGLTLEDLPELIERVQNIMQRTYKDLQSEVTGNLSETYPINK